MYFLLLTDSLGVPCDISCDGGQSSLGYLFGTGETTNNFQHANTQGEPLNGGRTQNDSVASPATVATPARVASPLIDKETPAGIYGCLKNNYHRIDEQNIGNFLSIPVQI
ncbi:hypothetical protein MtrunA17_Chr7g0223141 [Medicago truncatula]|uniref:Uncharacterized protein n=1 Tax=Medicago truncatula TaxID=3880 RepID=A0A396GUR2_MEDTR|nr:hypothetical protein MtrunA17_Chr7g0223141 [Medicago truncatula]